MTNAATTGSETPAQRIERLETSIEAALRNHKLLSAGGPVVTQNNAKLRAGLARVAEGSHSGPQAAAVRDELRRALAAPYRYERPEPPEFTLPDEQSPDGESDRIAWLERRLRACQHANYLIQEAGSPIVWNSDYLRDAIRTIVRRLEDDGESADLVRALAGLLPDK